MIVKEKSNSMKRLKYLIAMPLAVVSMLLFTCNVSAGTYKERAVLSPMIPCLLVRLILCEPYYTLERYR